MKKSTKKNPTKRSHELRIIAAAVKVADAHLAWFATTSGTDAEDERLDAVTDSCEDIAHIVDAARAAGALPRRKK